MRLLLIGSGFVGYALLEEFAACPGYEVTVTSRQASHIKALEADGFRTIQLSLEDADLIEQAVSEFDIVINSSSSDHPKSVDAILKGIQNRINAGKKTIFIHTSGTGVLTDLARGNTTSDLIFYDTHPEQFDTIFPGAPHRAIDKTIAQHAAKWHKTGLVEIRIMVPPMIYGQSRGFKHLSHQIPTLIRASIQEGYAGVHGQGVSISTHVHLDDLVKAFHILLDALVKDGSPKPQSDEDVYIFCEQGTEYSWIEVSREVGKSLYNRGIIADPTPKPFPEDKLVQLGLIIPGEQMHAEQEYQAVGANSRSKAVKLRQLGWKPEKASKEAFFATIDKDVDAILRGDR